MILGSLFDGSGGFPLGGVLNGITPLWASEIEPFSIAVTKKRFPNMNHYGDISKIQGGDIEPVDIITFGSPCQDMSMAGKRVGLEGNRSNLFYQAVRIIKEMREKTNGKYPKYAVWENVIGAFSSNNGDDFRSVLQSFCDIKGHKYDVPKPKKWEHAGQIVGNDFSVAWRVLDAQYWGVPQRRKRIYLVADFRGECAGKILFESESVSGYIETSKQLWARDARHTENSTRKTGIGFDGYNGFVSGTVASTLGTDCAHSTGRSGVLCLCDQGGQRMDILTNMTSTLRAEAHHPPIVLENHPADSRIKICKDNIVQTLSSRMGTGGNNVPLILYPTISIEGNGSRPSHFGDGYKESDVSYTLNTIEVHGCAYAVKQGESDVLENNSLHDQNTDIEYIARRFTPSECASLQGFPKWWCCDIANANPTIDDIEFWKQIFNTYCDLNNKKRKSEKEIRTWLNNPYSDSAEYKMWGNGVALPCVNFVLAGIAWYEKNNLWKQKNDFTVATNSNSAYDLWQL